MILPSSNRPSQPASAAVDAGLRWPDARRMFEGAWELDWKRRVKYVAREAMTMSARARILEACVSDGFARELLRSRPRAYYPVMSHLLDRRFGVDRRLQATLASIRAMSSTASSSIAATLLNKHVELLNLEDGTRLTLSLNDVSFHEGLWQVGLYASAGHRLYSIGFGLTSEREILIGNVQGPSLGCGGLEDNRQLTHAAHGMRPPYLLLRALRSLAAAWRSDSLKGVDPDNHVKGRWNLQASRLKFNYRQFWAENGGSRVDLGNWQLPLKATERALEDVPSRKRAMYRRRYEMLESLDEQIERLSSPSGGAVHATDRLLCKHLPGAEE